MRRLDPRVVKSISRCCSILERFVQFDEIAAAAVFYGAACCGVNASDDVAGHGYSCGRKIDPCLGGADTIGEKRDQFQRHTAA